MDRRSVKVARGLADQGVDERRRNSILVFIAALLALVAFGLLRTAPAFAGEQAVAKSGDKEAVRKSDDSGQDVELGVVIASKQQRHDGTRRDATGPTGGTKRTDGTGRGVHTGKTGNTAKITDGVGKTGRTGNTANVTDGGKQTVKTGRTQITDGTGKTNTGRTGDTGLAGYTDGGGNTGPEGNTGYWTDGWRGTGPTGNTVMPTDGRG